MQVVEKECASRTRWKQEGAREQWLTAAKVMCNLHMMHCQGLRRADGGACACVCVLHQHLRNTAAQVRHLLVQSLHQQCGFTVSFSVLVDGGQPNLTAVGAALVCLWFQLSANEHAMRRKAYEASQRHDTG